MSEATLNYRRAVRLLRENGYQVTTRARHGVKMVKAGEPRPVILPRHGNRDYGKGLANSILKQAGLKSMEDQAWSSRSSSTRSAGASGQRSASYRDASRPAER